MLRGGLKKMGGAQERQGVVVGGWIDLINISFRGFSLIFQKILPTREMYNNKLK